MAWLILIAVCFLAYSNGANDNFKGVASLFGSRTASYNTAIRWATATTLAGSAAAFFLASSLLGKFSGRGIVPDSIAGSESFLLAVAFGAGSTVILATITGFPISTTHGLVGAIFGVGLMAVGKEVNFAALQSSFLIPLFLSPMLAVGAGSAIYGLASFSRRGFGIDRESCICIGQEFVPVSRNGQTLAFDTGLTTVTVGVTEACVERYNGNLLGVSVQDAVDYAHFLSAGVVSFARGLNDTPKIVALLLAVQFLDIKLGWAFVALAVAVGGLLSARKVADTMSHKITGMNPGQAFAANLATGMLVILANSFGMPVSTTHVSVGSLFGIGLMTKQANLKSVSVIFSSWIITLPCSAVISAMMYWILVSVI